MLLRGLVLLSLVARASCDCYCSGNLNVPDATGTQLIGNPIDDNFQPCLKSGGCTYTFGNKDASKGWTGLTVTWNSPTAQDPNNDGTLVVRNSDGSEMATVVAGNTVTPGSEIYNRKSITPSINVTFTQTKGDPAIFGAQISPSGSLGQTTTPRPTTQAPTTRTYQPGTFKKDPYLISHDLFVAIDQGVGQGANGLNALKTLINGFMSILAISQDYGTNYYTRIGLAGIIPYQPGYSILGQVWALNATDLRQALQGVQGFSIGVNVKDAFSGILDLAFQTDNANVDPHQYTRLRAQRTLIFFTAAVVGDIEDLKGMKDTFSSRGVNLLVVGFNLTEADRVKYADSTNPTWFSYAGVNGIDNANIAKFVNPFFLSATDIDQSTVPFCNNPQQTSFDGTSFNETTPDKSIQEPVDYKGPAPDGSWTPNNGVANRYCNFQSKSYSWNNPNAKTLTFTVYYELEVERDWLRFYDDSGEIASFSGYDVTGATLTSNGNVTAEFTTDNKVVYGGFYVAFNYA